MRLHIDTDLGGDPDDACALAMILGWPDVDVVGVTTNLDIGGRRAGCATHVLRLARRDDVPVAAGAAASLTTSRQFPSTWSDCRYWPDAVDALPSRSTPPPAFYWHSVQPSASWALTGSPQLAFELAYAVGPPAI